MGAAGEKWIYGMITKSKNKIITHDKPAVIFNQGGN
jgi:hypothetical protein